MNCIICNKKLRSDNAIKCCREHRGLSPVLREKLKIKQNSLETKTKRKEYWKSLTSEERSELRKVNKIASKKYRDNNKEKRTKVCMEWNKNNPDKFRKIAKRARDKKRSTPQGNISHRMEVSMNISLRGNKAGRKWESLVGYTVNELKNHLEKLFTFGMNWDEFLKGNIHIDHIIPRSFFRYSSEKDEQFQQCWALSNLQPLWWQDNIKKSDKMPGEY